jgi:hypothetical protein
MKLSIFLSTALFATAALAAPNTLAKRLQDRGLIPRDNPVNMTSVSPRQASSPEQSSPTWAGAGLVTPPDGDTYKTVHASTYPSVLTLPWLCRSMLIPRLVAAVTVPTMSGNTDSAAAFWIGIDGFGIDLVIQAGFDVFLSADGTVSYMPWYEWFPAVRDLLSL